MEKTINKVLLVLIGSLTGMGILYILQVLEDTRHEFIFMMVVLFALVLGYGVSDDKS